MRFNPGDPVWVAVRPPQHELHVPPGEYPATVRAQLQVAPDWYVVECPGWPPPSGGDGWLVHEMLLRPRRDGDDSRSPGDWSQIPYGWRPQKNWKPKERDRETVMARLHRRLDRALEVVGL